MTRNVRFLLCAALLSLVMVAAACGDDDAVDTAEESSSTDTAAPEAGETSGSDESASDASWDAVVAAAEEEGKVVLYSVMVPDVNDRLVAAFSEAYPDIDIELLRVMGNEIDARLDAEEGTGTEGADVVANVNYPWALEASEEGRLSPFAGPNSMGPNWEGTDYLIDDDVQMSTFANLGLAWNTDALPDGGPTSFEDMLDPAYAGGKIGVVDPIAPVLADFYATLEDNLGPEYLEQLADQDPVFYPSAVPLEQALASGEVDVAIYATNQGITTAQSDGAPVEFASPENAWLPPILSYIPSWAARPNAAQVLIDFMASEEGQAVLGQGSFSPVPGIEGTFGSLDEASAANVQRSVEPGWYEDYYTRFNEIFGR